MAFRTRLFVRAESVQVAEMALPAADILHKDMPGMTIGVAQALRSLGYIRNMTCPAGVPGGNPSMLLLDRLIALDDKGDKHLVLLKQCHGMAHLARVIPVLAFLPGLKCVLHEMTGRAEIRVFPRIMIITVCQDTPDNRDQKEQKYDCFFVLFYEVNESRGPVRHALASLPAQETKEFVEEKGKNKSHEGAECGKDREDDNKSQPDDDAL
jgi:hypothetical protein